jgi:hypothetical protein
VLRTRRSFQSNRPILARIWSIMNLVQQSNGTGQGESMATIQEHGQREATWLLVRMHMVFHHKVHKTRHAFHGESVNAFVVIPAQFWGSCHHLPGVSSTKVSLGCVLINRVLWARED